LDCFVKKVIGGSYVVADALADHKNAVPVSLDHAAATIDIEPFRIAVPDALG
jgi:hypothetical protein